MEFVKHVELIRRLERIEAVLLRTQGKKFYSVEELARLVDREPFTVRQWCKQGRIKAVRTLTRTGPSQRWAISHEEYERYQREGLLPLQRRRASA